MRRRVFMQCGVGTTVMLGVTGRVYAKKKEAGVKLNAKVPMFESTLMGVIRGVADFYELPLSDAMLYGASGHAFMINIHEALCPSGPYCWKREPFYALLPNLGIEMKDQGFFGGTVAAQERARIEKVLKNTLDSRNPCGLVNMEYQLISGYDETGFFTSQPWAPHNSFPPARLAFDTWAEFGGEIHVNFFTFSKVKPVPKKEMCIAGIRHGLDIYANPGNHSSAPYFTGEAAYDAFVKAVEAGHGAEHGCWWNATVWAECRRMAAQFLTEIAPEFPTVSGEIEALSKEYAIVAENLKKVSDKALAAEPKVALLKDAQEREAGAVERMSKVAASL